MKALVFREAYDIYIDEYPTPSIGDDDVLVKVLACGVCGTDIHILRGEHIVKFPVIPGHEFCGRIVQAGDNVNNVKVGDLVTIDPNIVDQTCFFCRRGEIQLCENLTAIGVNFNGGFAEYCCVPAKQALEVPSDMIPEEAAMTEPVACCIHGVDRLGLIEGQSVVIQGAGSIGLIILQILKSGGAYPIIVSEPDEKKRNLALNFGADVVLDPNDSNLQSEITELTKVGADIVIESAGVLAASQMAAKLARRGGTVLHFGVLPAEQMIQVSPYEIYYKELKIIGSFVNPFTHSRAIKMISSGKVNIKPLITHKFALCDALAAMECAQSGQAVKIMIYPEL